MNINDLVSLFSPEIVALFIMVGLPAALLVFMLILGWTLMQIVCRLFTGNWLGR